MVFMVCDAADTVSLATWFLFDKLFLCCDVFSSVRSGVVKIFR